MSQELGQEPSLDGSVGPRRRNLEETDLKVIQRQCEAELAVSALDAVMADEDVDLAWQILSKAAENALAKDFCGRDETVGRACLWAPKKLGGRQGAHKAASKSFESCRLRRLRRLQRQLKQLQRQAELRSLRNSVGKALAALKAAHAELEGAFAWNAEAFAEAVDKLLEEAEQADEERRVLEWRADMASNTQKQAAWIKRKTDQQLAMSDSGLPRSFAEQAVHKAVHPVQRILGGAGRCERGASQDPAAPGARRAPSAAGLADRLEWKRSARICTGNGRPRARP